MENHKSLRNVQRGKGSRRLSSMYSQVCHVPHFQKFLGPFMSLVLCYRYANGVEKSG